VTSRDRTDVRSLVVSLVARRDWSVISDDSAYNAAARTDTIRRPIYVRVMIHEALFNAAPSASQ
jgi:hypothetical protein